MADYAIHDTTLIGTSSIIRKKEGSSALIDPADYPKRINLMGMLEEKTASSASICSFSDGADDVPMKSVIAHIVPTLTGKNAVNMVQSGKNLASGGVYEYNARNMIIAPVYLRAGTYTVSFNRGVNVQYIYIRKGDTVNLVGDAYATKSNTTFFTFTADEDEYYYAQLYRTNTSDTWEDYPVTQPQIEVGSTPTQYTAYEAPTTYTANLGRTVYGADVDLVSGQGIAGWALHKVTSNDGIYDYSTGSGFRVSTSTWTEGIMKAESNNGGICNEFDTVTNNTNRGVRFSIGDNTSIYFVQVYSEIGNTVEAFKTWLDNHDVYVVYPLATGTAFTFDGQEIPSMLGVNNLWHDAGNTEAVYRSSGTVTPVPIQPVLISKTITENGTYIAEDDDADGYDEVTVNVQGGGEEPFVPQFTETLIGDNTAHASSFTLTEDYGNYDMVKIVWYESASVSGFLYTTPDILDEIFSVGVGKLCINKPSTNYYICYSKSGLTWTQTNQRNIYVHEIYGVTFTNCTMTATDLYKRGASTTTKYAITSQTSLKDYDLFVMSSIHATDGSETMPTTWLYQYPKENMNEAFSCPVPTVLQEYNANDEAFVISEYGMTSARYFMVQGITFTPTPSLLSMSPSPTPSEPDSEDPEEVEEEES